MTRQFALVLALLAVLMIPAAARADTVVLTDWTTGAFASNAAYGGGAFRATTTGTLLGNSSFVTFCLEVNEYFSYGTQYNFTLSDAAVNGGVSGGSPDPVSDATRWLYYQVVSGGYALISAFGTSPGVGARVQEAIWYLEGERTQGQINADAFSLASYATTNQNWGGLYAQGNRVYAMNLTDQYGNRVQDQLAYSSIAEPGSLLLLGSGLIVMATLVRRRRS